MLGRNIVLFANVRPEVIEFDRRARLEANRLPVAEPHRLLRAPLVEFPVQVRMRRLLALAQQSRRHGEAVHAFGALCSGEFGTGREEIPESPWQVTHRPGLNMSRPA